MPDNTLLPRSLFHSGRAQCPDCGANLELTELGALVHCRYCGGTAAVQRRLRTIEPVLSDGFITADAPVDRAGKLRPSQVIDGVAQDESHCPACGVEIDPADTQAIRTCRHCGTQCKVERRLLRSPEVDDALVALDQAPRDQRQFAATEALVVAVETLTDFPSRVRAAWELGEMWTHANARAARLLPRIMKIMQTADDRLAMHLAELVGKLICSEEVAISNAVIRAAEKFVFDFTGSQTLLRQLSLGSGAGLKLLLDAADYAGTNGAIEYACSALWGVNTMFERNYADRMRLAEIVLYRLLYLKGPVQAWAIELAKGQLGLGCRFPAETLLHFMDDCAAERPELLPHVRQCFYEGPAKTAQAWFDRLGLVEQLLTEPAKIAAVSRLTAPPIEMDEAAASRALGALENLTHDPKLGDAAITAVIYWIEDDQPLRPCVYDMIKRVGDQLPESVRRAFLRREPNSPLLIPLPVRYTNSPAAPEKSPFDLQLEQWKQMWNTGIRAAVAKHEARQTAARAYWTEIHRPVIAPPAPEPVDDR